MGNKSSKRQFLVRADTLEGFWARKTGGNITADVSKAYDGGNPIPDLISSPPAADNVTLSRTFDPDRDLEILRRLRPLVGSFRTTVTWTPTDADMVAIGPPVTYSDALLVAINEPEVDAGSGDAADFDLEFAISNYR